jgi:hypothetical protein
MYGHRWRMFRVGQNRIYTLYMTVYSVISLPKVAYIHRIYMVLANPTYVVINMVLANPNGVITIRAGQTTLVQYVLQGFKQMYGHRWRILL